MSAWQVAIPSMTLALDDVETDLSEGWSLSFPEGRSFSGTWFNRLVYDAGQEESARETWTIAGPSSGEALRPAGLLGPVRIVGIF